MNFYAQETRRGRRRLSDFRQIRQHSVEGKVLGLAVVVTRVVPVIGA